MNKITNTGFAALFLAAALVLPGAVSCTGESAPVPASVAEAVNTPEPGEIVFGVSGAASIDVETTTKAFTEVTTVATGWKCVGIVDSSDSLMFCATASHYSAGVYRISGEKHYFPVSGTSSFYGIYPTTCELDIDGSSVTFDYETDTDIDIVAATRRNVNRTAGSVDMTFDHILSRLSFALKGTDTNADYRLKSINVGSPLKGTYSLTEGAWISYGTETLSYTPFTYTPSEPFLALSTSAYTDVGVVRSYIPGDILIHVVWTCLQKGTSTVIGEYAQSVTVSVEPGKDITLNLSLPNSDARQIGFTTSVNSIRETSEYIDVQPEEINFRMAIGNLECQIADFPAALNPGVTIYPAQDPRVYDWNEEELAEVTDNPETFNWSEYNSWSCKLFFDCTAAKGMTFDEWLHSSYNKYFQWYPSKSEDGLGYWRCKVNFKNSRFTDVYLCFTNPEYPDDGPMLEGQTEFLGTMEIIPDYIYRGSFWGNGESWVWGEGHEGEFKANGVEPMFAG